MIFKRVIAEAAEEKEKENDQGSQRLTRSGTKGEEKPTNEGSLYQGRRRRNSKNNPQRMHQTVKG